MTSGQRILRIPLGQPLTKVWTRLRVVIVVFNVSAPYNTKALQSDLGPNKQLSGASDVIQRHKSCPCLANSCPHITLYVDDPTKVCKVVYLLERFSFPVQQALWSLHSSSETSSFLCGCCSPATWVGGATVGPGYQRNRDLAAVNFDLESLKKAMYYDHAQPAFAARQTGPIAFSWNYLFPNRINSDSPTKSHFRRAVLVYFFCIWIPCDTFWILLSNGKWICVRITYTEIEKIHKRLWESLLATHSLHQQSGQGSFYWCMHTDAFQH